MLFNKKLSVKSSRVCSHYKLKRTRTEKGNKFINAEYDKLDEWNPIRILPDYSGLKSQDPASIKLTEIIKTKIIPKTIKVFQEILKVRKTKSIILNENSCNSEYLIPKDVFGPNNPKETDLIILVNYDITGEYKELRVEAGSIYCFQDKKTKRPLVGLITFRDNLEVNTDVDIDYLVWLSLHEISHILLFNEELYNDFIDKITLESIGIDNVIKTVKNEHGQNVNKVITKKVVEKARNHFNCRNLEGVALEYNGSQNSIDAHWSRKFLNTDFMIGRSHGENLISDISLAFYEDSGWYEVDYEKANIFYWGKNKGCEFFKKNCVKNSKFFDKFLKARKFKKDSEIFQNKNIIIKYQTNFKEEFCEEANQPVCSMHNMFRGFCGVRIYDYNLPKQDQNFSYARIGGFDNFVNRCPIVVENKFSQQYYGGSCRWGSKEDLLPYEKVCLNCGCFISSLSKNQIKEGKFLDTLKETFNFSIYSKPSELNRKASCIEFECIDDEINVIIDGNKNVCPSNKSIKIDGYFGRIKCPDRRILCNKSYFCKFGCTKIE